jgi:hypothetical protein
MFFILLFFLPGLAELFCNYSDFIYNTRRYILKGT